MSSDDLEIALVTPWDTGGGIANYSERLRSAVESAGHNITVIQIRNPKSRNPFGFNDLIQRIPSQTDIVHVQFEAGVFGHLLISGICAPVFYRRLARADWSVVTTLHEIHRSYPGHSSIEESLVKTRDRILERFILSASDATVVHTNEAEVILQNRHGGGNFIKQMRHPVDSPVAPPTDRKHAREELGVTANKVLLTFGWVEPKKQYQDVIHCLPDLSDAEYLIAGEPRHESDEETLKEVFALAERLGVRERVRHLGYVADEDLPTLFGATDFTVVPYNQVTQSGAANTALAYSCPVVARSLPAFEELAREYECVMTYDDHDTLREIVRDGTEDDTKTRLQEAAKRYAETETWAAFAEKTTMLYDNLVDESSESTLAGL